MLRSIANHPKMVRLRAWYGDFSEFAKEWWRTRTVRREFLNQHPGYVVPPLGLAFDAYGSMHWFVYHNAGRIHAESISRAILRHAPDASQVCEWGCGPMRILRHMPGFMENAHFIGTDYNPTTIRWNSRNFPGFTFIENALLPPLPLETESLDVLYAVSVFTHIAQETGRLYIEDIMRCLRPGGVLLFTTHGDRYASGLAGEELKGYLSGHFVCRHRGREGKKLFTAFHSPRYVREVFVKDYEILEHTVDEEIPYFSQDMWVVKKPDGRSRPEDHMPSVPRPEQAAFSIRLRSFDDYCSFKHNKADELAQQRAFEEKLRSDHGEEFTIKGACHTCGAPSRLAVTYEYGYEDNGVLKPNWREHLTCERCGLNNRRRGTLHILDSIPTFSQESVVCVMEGGSRVQEWLEARHDRLVGRFERQNSQSLVDHDRLDELVHMSFREGFFDIVLCLDLLQETTDYRKALSELCRILRKGGQLLLTTPFALESSHNQLSQRLLEIPEESRTSDGGDSTHRFGWELLTDMVEAGFSDVSAHLYWSREYGYLGSGQVVIGGTREGGPSSESILDKISMMEPEFDRLAAKLGGSNFTRGFERDTLDFLLSTVPSGCQTFAVGPDISCALFAWLCCHHTVTEVSSEHAEILTDLFEAHGIDLHNVGFVETRAYEMLDTVDDLSIDVAVINGGIGFHEAYISWCHLTQKLKKTGLVIIQDDDEEPRCQEFTEYLRVHPAWRIAKELKGATVFKKIRKREDGTGFGYRRF